MSVYDNLSGADGNDLIEELNSIRKLLAESSSLANADQLVGDYEELVRELTIREEG